MVTQLHGALWISGIAFVGWAGLLACQLGWVPAAQHAWAMRLFAYHAGALQVALAAVGLVAAVPPLRGRILRVLDTLAAVRSPALPLLGAVAVAASLWVLRERGIAFAPDAHLLVALALEGMRFDFPEVGATILLVQAVRLPTRAGWNALPVVQAGICVLGGVMFLLLAKIGRRLLPDRSAVLLVPLFVGSGGLARIFAGHVEVYALLLVSAALYVWAALRALETGRGWLLACLALGVAGWIHAAAVCLVPSLVVLPWLGPDPPPPGRAPGLLALGALVALLPWIVFVPLYGLLGEPGELTRAWSKVLEILGHGQSTFVKRWWVRGWGGLPSIGTDVVFFSRAHLKYLWNACWILAPSTVPILATCAVLAPRRWLASRETRFLAAAAAPLLIYASALRPFWGPFDWDLFSLTAFVLLLLQLRVLAELLDACSFRHLTVSLVILQLAFVGLPFLGIARGTVRDAGPFGGAQYLHKDMVLPVTPPPPALAPWL